MPTYRIKDWDKHFENHESRKVKGVRWVALPNKHDGKSYRRLTKLPGAPGVFAAWCLIVQVASKMPERGILADEDGPLTVDDLSDMTGFPVEIFTDAFKALSDKRIGWLEVELSEAESEVISRNLPQSPGIPGTAGAVGNGTEGYGREEKTHTLARARPPSGPFGIYLEIFGQPTSIHNQTLIEAEVTDLDCWRRVLTRLQANGIPAGKVGTFVDAYRDEVKKQRRAPPATPEIPSFGASALEKFMREEEEARHAGKTTAEQR